MHVYNAELQKKIDKMWMIILLMRRNKLLRKEDSLPQFLFPDFLAEIANVEGGDGFVLWEGEFRHVRVSL